MTIRAGATVGLCLGHELLEILRTRTALGSYRKAVPRSIGPPWGRCVSLFARHTCSNIVNEVSTPRSSMHQLIGSETQHLNTTSGWMYSRGLRECIYFVKLIPLHPQVP